jgi:hypothetical protein
MKVMATSGSRFTVERQKLCIWLQSEKRKLHTLPSEMKVQRDQELEREFRLKLDRLYNDSQHRVDLKAKMN